MKIEKKFIVRNHSDGENESETIIEMQNIDDGMEFDDLSIELKNEEAQAFPVNSRVRLTIEPIS